MQRDDLLVIVLVGHGTVDDGLAKFNLVGPDLTSEEWGALLADLPGRVVAVNTTGGSFPFLRDLADRGRIVVTATESTAQRYDTVFPEQLMAALKDPAADLDKNGRVSVWELFVRTSKRRRRALRAAGAAGDRARDARRHGRRRGNRGGRDRRGRSAGSGDLSRTRQAVDADPELAELLTRRRALEEQAERLKQRKSTMPIEAWEREFEALMIELARVSRRIRSRS